MDDRAEGGVIGEVLLVALGLVMAAAFVVWYGHAATDTRAPDAIGLNRDASSTSTTASYSISSVTGTPAWSQFRVVIDGAVASYDSTLAATPSYCVTGTSGCIATGSWTPSTTTVAAGQVVRFHATSLSGKHIAIVDLTAGALAADLQMP